MPAVDSHAAVRRMIEKRCRQAISRILQVKDELKDYIPPGIGDDFTELVSDELDEFAERLRSVVLDQVNEFAELCLDLLEAVGRDDIIVNELAVQMLSDIHQAVTRPPATHTATVS